MADEKNDALREWAAQLTQYTPISWARMPDLNLYMDQVIAFMEQQLAFYRRNAQSKTLTPSMINNYAKESLLDRPVNKRYTREHLAELMMISMLKPVLSIADIAAITRNAQPGGLHDAEQLYAQFSDAQTNTVRALGQHLTAMLDAGDMPATPADAALLVMQMGLQANAYRVAAEKLLDILLPTEPDDKHKKEKENP